MNANWSYSPKTAKLGFDLSDLDLWPLTLTFCMDITSVMGNHSWEHSENGVTDGRTNGQTERSVLRAAWSQLKIFMIYLTLTPTDGVFMVGILKKINLKHYHTVLRLTCGTGFAWACLCIVRTVGIFKPLFKKPVRGASSSRFAETRCITCGVPKTRWLTSISSHDAGTSEYWSLLIVPL